MSRYLTRPGAVGDALAPFLAWTLADLLAWYAAPLLAVAHGLLVQSDDSSAVS